MLAMLSKTLSTHLQLCFILLPGSRQLFGFWFAAARTVVQNLKTLYMDLLRQQESMSYQHPKILTHQQYYVLLLMPVFIMLGLHPFE